MAAATKHNRAGRKTYRKHPRSRQRRNVTQSLWARTEAPLLIGNDQWRIVVDRGDKKDYVILDDEVTQISWDDVSDVLTGQVTWMEFGHEYRKQDTSRTKTQGKHVKPPLIPDTGYGGIEEGHVFELHWRPSQAAQWSEVWRMRAWQPEIDAVSGEVTMTLANDMAYLQKSQGHFRFGKSKKFPNGVRLDTIMKSIAKLYHVQLSSLPKLAHRVLHFSVDGSPLEALQKVLLLERNEGDGRKFFMRSRKGKLAVLQLRQSRDMLILGPALIDATIKRSLGTNFQTSMTVRGTLRSKAKGKKKRTKLAITVTSDAAVRRFGYIHGEVTVPAGTKTVADARKYVLNQLHKHFKPSTEIDLTHPGIPSLRRNDAILISIPNENVNVLAWCKEVHHTLSPGDYEMSLVVQFTDPFVDKANVNKELKKCQTAQKRKRKLSASCRKLLRDQKKPKKAKQRKDKASK